MNRRKIFTALAAMLAALPLFGKKRMPDVSDEIKATELPGDMITPQLVMAAIHQFRQQGLTPSHWLVGLGARLDWYRQGVTIASPFRGKPRPEPIIYDDTFWIGDLRAIPCIGTGIHAKRLGISHQVVLCATDGTQLEVVGARVTEYLGTETPHADFITLNAPADWDHEKCKEFANSVFTPAQQISTWTSGRIGDNGILAWRIPIWLESDGTFSPKNHDIYKMREVKS